MNVYRAADDQWLVLGIVTPDKSAAVAKGIGRADLLTDPRFTEPAKLAATWPSLRPFSTKCSASQPMAHWHEVLSGAHITFSVVMEPAEVVKDPQLRANDIVVPLEGAGGKLTFTISSPIQMHGVAKVPARRARKSANTTKRFSNSSGSMRPKSRASARAVPSRVSSIQKSNHGSWTMSEILTERSGEHLCGFS